MADINKIVDGNGNAYNVRDSDAARNTPTFSQASSRANLSGSGETMPTILGKIKKWFADLKALAFKDKVSDSDISGTIQDAHIASASTWNGKIDGFATEYGEYAKGGWVEIIRHTCTYTYMNAPFSAYVIGRARCFTRIEWRFTDVSTKAPAIDYIKGDYIYSTPPTLKYSLSLNSSGERVLSIWVQKSETYDNPNVRVEYGKYSPGTITLPNTFSNTEPESLTPIETTCLLATSSYSATGTRAVNGTAVAAAISGKANSDGSNATGMWNIDVSGQQIAAVLNDCNECIPDSSNGTRDYYLASGCSNAPVSNRHIHIIAMRGHNGDRLTQMATASGGSLTGNGELYTRVGNLSNSTWTFGAWVKMLASVDISGKADKKVPSAANNVALLDSNGNLVDSGKTLGKSVPSNAVFTDTKNTAGSSNSTAKLFLIGSNTQGSSPQTYSNSKIYSDDNFLIIDGPGGEDIEFLVIQNGVSKVSLTAGSGNVNRGVYDEQGGAWLAWSDASNIARLGKNTSDEVYLGKVKLNFSGTVGTSNNTIYFA
ncbi:hypothetical protein [Fibrobacter sp.]|uniref:hypothetical protein n=1 Tax=Fibrobacter sp. TaxID=35828 RepID=UPI00388E12D9